MSKKESSKEKKNNNFLKELKAELKKVTWPTFKKLVNNTLAVISIVLILSVIVFVLDVCFENLNKFGVEKLKSFISSDSDMENEEELDGSDETDDFVETIPEEDIEENVPDENNEESGADSEEQTADNPEEVIQ